MKKNVSIGITHLIGLILLVILLGISSFWALQKVKRMTCRNSRNETRLALLRDSLNLMHDSIRQLHDSLYDTQLFSLANNDEALDYLDKYYGARKDWYAYVRDKLLDESRAHPDRVFPYASVYGPWGISNVRILNHKWLIMSMSDGHQWGEVLMEYEPVGKDSVRFDRLRAFLYPPVGQ